MKPIAMISLFLAFLLAAPAFAVQSTITEAEGHACLGDDRSRRQTEQAAETDARRRVLESVQSYIDSETQVEDFNELSSAESGAVVFAASTGRQFSLEDDRWQNGAFTKALVEGLSGRADYQKDGAITIKELDLYLSERVKELTGGKQSPTTAIPKTIPDFPIVMY